MVYFYKLTGVIYSFLFPSLLNETIKADFSTTCFQNI